MVRNRLADLLAETQTSQQTLAKAIGVSKTTINNFARNEPHKLLTMIDAICNYFGVEPGDLLYTAREEEEASEGG